MNQNGPNTARQPEPAGPTGLGSTEAPADCYEVMVDEFGADGRFRRGHLLTRADVDAAGVPLEHALVRGHLREAPEYRRALLPDGGKLISTVQPVEGQPFAAPWSPESRGQVAPVPARDVAARTNQPAGFLDAQGRLREELQADRQDQPGERDAAAAVDVVEPSMPQAPE